MLSSLKRLRTREVGLVQRTGAAVSSPFGRIKYQKNGSVARFAVVVSKKSLKSAVSRNTFRRRLYTLLPAIKIEGGLFVINVHNTQLGANQKDLKKELEILFSKISKT